MSITSAKYISDSIDTEINIGIRAVINEITCDVPLDPANTDYVEIMRQVDAGELTIEEAE